MKHLAYVTLVALSTGCLAQAGGDDGTEVEQGVSTSYVDIVDFGDNGWQWYDVSRALNAQFAQECGDTFCEGDWSNIVPLSVSCSVSSKLGSVRDCAWTFAAVDAQVDPRTAALLVNAPTFQCHFKAKTTAKKLIALLGAAEDKLRAPLPGAPSINEQLSDCFDHPLDATPGTISTGDAVTYVSARDYYASAAGLDRWSKTVANLKAGFDRVCGDTFCGGDFGDLQAVDFSCAITKSTGNVKSCAWTFGGSWHLVPEKGGQLDVHSSTFRCDVPVKGTLSQLISTLTAPTQWWEDEYLRLPLPGTTATAYDALLGCLP